MGLGQSSLTKLRRMPRSRRNQLGFTALQPQLCPCELHKLRDIRYMVEMGEMRDKVEAHGAFVRVFVLGKRWAWDSQV